MGFWNETCLISRLPILYKDPCVGLFIAMRDVPDGMTYSDSFATPVLPPIRGQYNAYGMLTGFHTDANKELYNYLSKIQTMDMYNYVYKKSGRSYVGVNIADLHYMMQLAKNGELFARTVTENNAVKYQPVYFVMMHESLFNLSKHFNPTQEQLDKTMNAMRRNINIADIPKACAEELFALQAFMNRHRITLQPTAGKGYQTALDDKADLDLYKEIHEKAKEIHCCRTWSEQDEDD